MDSQDSQDLCYDNRHHQVSVQIQGASTEVVEQAQLLGSATFM